MALAPGAAAIDEEPRVVWGGGARTQADLAEWLAARGITYGAWAQRHPAAAARLRGEVVPAPPPEREPQEELAPPEDTTPPVFAQVERETAPARPARPRAEERLFGRGSAAALLVVMVASVALVLTARRAAERQRELIALAACIPISVALGILVARLGGL